MGIRCFVLICSLLAANSVAAQSRWHERLRNEVRMPTWREQMLIDHNYEGLRFFNEVPSRMNDCLMQVPAKFAANEIGDGLLDLAIISRDRGDTVTAHAYIRMAIGNELLALHKRPNDPETMLRISYYCSWMDQFKLAEQWLERAKPLAPRNAEYWRVRCKLFWGQACAQFKQIPSGSMGSPTSLAAEIMARPLTELQLRIARESLEHARDAMDMAVWLSPQNPKYLAERIQLTAHRAMIEMVTAGTVDRPANAQALAQSIVDDAERWMQLRPESPRIIASAIMAEMNATTFDGDPEYTDWHRLSEATQRSVRRKMQMIERLCDLVDLTMQFDANLMLGTIHLQMFGQPHMALPHLRRAFELRNDHSIAAHLYCEALAESHRWDRLALVSESALRVNPTSIPLLAFRTEALLRTGHRHEAMKVNNRLRESSPANPEETLLVGTAWLREAHPEFVERGKPHFFRCWYAVSRFNHRQQRELLILSTIGGLLETGDSSLADEVIRSAVGHDEMVDWLMRVQTVLSTERIDVPTRILAPLETPR